MGKPRKKLMRPGGGQSWTEDFIARTLAYQLFNGRSVLVVPRCHWAGGETDLLVITPCLRIIDVEIKISRADLRADIKKDKWWRSRPWSRRYHGDPALRRSERRSMRWPDRVWKHYYVVPADIWDDGLLAGITDASGVLLLDRSCRKGLRVLRHAKPDRDAKPITPADAIDIARLASLRMWAALTK